MNPEGEATTYHFEYGPSVAYGKSTTESASVGSDSSGHAVGSLLTPVAQPFATCKHGTVKGELDGSLLGKITPVDTASTHFTITYQETAGVQALEKFEGSEALHDLEVNLGKGTEGFGVQAAFNLTTSKAIELKA